MAVDSLSIKAFRNIENAELEFSPKLNIISGSNASGKTSFLEALYFQGRAHSFRTKKPVQLIHRDADAFELFARISQTNYTGIPVGVGFGKQGLQVRVRGETVKRLSELANLFPLQLLAGNIHQLLEDGPRFRRRFLDWSLFHVEPAYAQEWRRYNRALKQRNAALRNKAAVDQVIVWNDDLIKSGKTINLYRTKLISNITNSFNKLFCYLVDEPHAINVKYQPGYPTGKSLETCLDEQLQKDRDQGFTQYGIHRADFSFQEDDKDIMPQLSRGQQKLLIIALQLSQPAKNLENQTGGLYLLDDLGAELDIQHQQRVMVCLSQVNIQAFITAIQPESILDACEDVTRRMFHVEHGNFTEVV
jgi:DNA replication and repair protein RecF